VTGAEPSIERHSDIPVDGRQILYIGIANLQNTLPLGTLSVTCLTHCDKSFWRNRCQNRTNEALLGLRPLSFLVFALLALLCFVLHCVDCIFRVLCVCVCIFSLSVSLFDISRTLIINYRWPTAIGLVPLWQPAKYV